MPFTCVSSTWSQSDCSGRFIGRNKIKSSCCFFLNLTKCRVRSNISGITFASNYSTCHGSSLPLSPHHPLLCCSLSLSYVSSLSPPWAWQGQVCLNIIAFAFPLFLMLLSDLWMAAPTFQVRVQNLPYLSTSAKLASCCRQFLTWFCCISLVVLVTVLQCVPICILDCFSSLEWEEKHVLFVNQNIYSLAGTYWAY